MRARPIRLTLSLLVSVAALTACGGGGGAPAVQTPAAGAASIAIRSWPAGSTGVLRMYRNATVDNLLVQVPVSAEGVVEYVLPEPGGLTAYSSQAGVVVDPPDARFQLVVNVTTSLDPSETQTGEVRMGNRLAWPSPQAGDTLVQLWYADRPTKVTGSADGCTYQQEFQAGWNYALTRIDTLEPYACAHSAAPVLPGGLGWHYVYLGP